MSALAQKMLAILKSVERIPKNGENKFHGYKYVTEADMVDYLRPKLAEAGIMVWTNVTEATATERPKERGGVTRIGKVKIEMTFQDAESGDSKTVSFFGEGEDSGDKIFYKAITGAEKYALMKTFLVSTGDDPERDDAKQPGAGEPSKARAEAVAVDRSSSGQPPATPPAPHTSARPSPPAQRSQADLVKEMQQAAPVAANTPASGLYEVRAWIRSLYPAEGKAPAKVMYVIDPKQAKGDYAKLWISNKNPEGSNRWNLLHTAHQEKLPVTLSLQRVDGEYQGKKKTDWFIEGVVLAEAEAAPEPQPVDDQYTEEQPF